MEILLFALGVILGAFFSWLITRSYYRKAKKDSDESMEKLKTMQKELAEKIINQLDGLPKEALSKDNIDRIVNETLDNTLTWNEY